MYSGNLQLQKHMAVNLPKSSCFMAQKQTTPTWLQTPSTAPPKALSRPVCLRPTKLCTCFDLGMCDHHH